jgi:Tfp pilus assembly protein PilF
MKPTDGIKDRLQHAMALHQQGEVLRAETIYNEVLRDDPNEPNAWHLLGVIAWQNNKLQQAEDYVRKAISIHDSTPIYHNNLAGILRQKGDLNAAIGQYEMTIKLFPSDQIAREQLVQTLHQQGMHFSSDDKWEESKVIYQRALTVDPNHIATLNSLAELILNQGDHKNAGQLFDRIFTIKPDDFVAHFNRGICHLSAGDLAEGWHELYRSARYWLSSIDRRTNLPWLKIRLWDGSNLKGKKILVWGDPGIGDEILFASMVPDLIAQGADVTIECNERLAPLFSRSFPEATLMARRPHPENIAFDWQVPGLLLGRWLRKNLDANFSSPYLKPDNDRVAEIRSRYRSFGKKRIVGLSWHSKTEHWGTYRRMPLREMIQALPLNETLFIDLQYGDTHSERDDVQRSFPALTLFHDDTIDQLKDLDGYAAQVAACDAVVTIGNTTPHMAGALGVRGAVLLPPAGVTWYWFTKGDWCPWYSSLKLLRSNLPNRLEIAATMIGAI